MAFFWTYDGLKFGIKSVKFPKENDFYDGFISSVKINGQKCISQNKTAGSSRKNSGFQCIKCEIACPTKAINLNNLAGGGDGKNGQALKAIDANRCIFCGLCIDICKDIAGAISYTNGLDCDIIPQNYAVKKKIFKKSLFVKHIDTGSCGACESEINALNNPYYNMHRLGIFITPSPRFADVLLVTGTFTKKMSDIFFNVLDNIPKPRYVIVAGSCALFGGVFENGFKNGGGNKGLLFNNQSEIEKLFKEENVIALPHCPPNPFEILNILLLIKKGGVK
jgi:Ni,Fe-hydrogenase III small subunit/NAD-dependent dihydropyrimidine dehydrogenase PreA subunit